MNIRKTFSLEISVKDIDQMENLKREKYIEFTERYFHQLLFEADFNFNDLKEKNAEFYCDAQINDNLILEICITGLKEKSFIVDSKFMKDETLLSEIKMNYVIKFL